MAAITRYTQEMIERYVQDGHWTPLRTFGFWLGNARLRPGGGAVTDGAESYTWAEGVRAVGAIAEGLVASGVPRDGRLLVQAPNSALFVLFRLACEEAGIIPVFLHQGFRRSEIEAVARKVKPVGALYADRNGAELSALYAGLRNRLGLQYLFTFEPGENGIPSIREFASVTGESSNSAHRRVRPYELTGIVTSSGTTGLPKCVEYSCWPRLASGRVYIDRLGIDCRDTILSCIPFYTGGGDMQFHAAPQAGAKLVVQPRFAPEETCALLEREQVTGAVMVPTMIARLAALPDLPSRPLKLKWVVCGGGMLSYEVGARFEDLAGAKIVQGYGLMDYGALASHGIDDPREKRLRSNGRIMPGTELRILDAAGRILSPNLAGEICARGPHCNGGYIGEPDGPHAAWRGGFFHTGDIGRLTDDGYVVLEGRSKDIIIRGGQNISAHEVETILRLHPGVADAALVRMADPDMGERACAFVVLRSGVALDFAQMVSFMKSQDVAPYKIPERLEIIHDLPLTAGGNKVDKRALEARLGVAAQLPLAARAFQEQA
jgi:non-ribosomal peptide synthetase component E (peptide arylation enzyme)